MKEFSCNFYYIISSTAFRPKNVHIVERYVMLYLVHIILPRVRYVQMSDVDYCPCLKFEELCSEFQLCLNAKGAHEKKKIAKFCEKKSNLTFFCAHKPIICLG